MIRPAVLPVDEGVVPRVRQGGDGSQPAPVAHIRAEARGPLVCLR